MPPPPPPSVIPQLSKYSNSAVKPTNSRNKLLGDINKGVQLKSTKHLMIDKSDPILTQNGNSSTNLKIKSNTSSINVKPRSQSQEFQPSDLSNIFVNGISKVKLRPVSTYIANHQVNSLSKISENGSLKPLISPKPQILPKPACLPPKIQSNFEDSKQFKPQNTLANFTKPPPPPPPPQSTKPKLIRSFSLGQDIVLSEDSHELNAYKYNNKAPDIISAKIKFNQVHNSMKKSSKHNVVFTDSNDISQFKNKLDINPGPVIPSHHKHERFVIIESPVKISSSRSDISFIDRNSLRNTIDESLDQSGSHLNSCGNLAFTDSKNLKNNEEIDNKLHKRTKKESKRRGSTKEVHYPDFDQTSDFEKQFKFHSPKDFPLPDQWSPTKKLYPSRNIKNPSTLSFNEFNNSSNSSSLRPNLETTV